MCSVDFEKAFDTVKKHGPLIETLKWYGVDIAGKILGEESSCQSGR